MFFFEVGDIEFEQRGARFDLLSRGDMDLQDLALKWCGMLDRVCVGDGGGSDSAEGAVFEEGEGGDAHDKDGERDGSQGDAVHDAESRLTYLSQWLHVSIPK